jgi:nucleobase:cation symporter-1, NCS1 family
VSPDSATLEPGIDPGRHGGVEDEPVFEARGIDYIPLADRRGAPRDLAWMWAGALFNVEYVVYGALLIVAFGLRFWQAVVVIVVGNLSYLITGLGSLQGPRAGTAAFTINRAPFGPNGAKLIAVFNWMTQVGYEVVGLALVVDAGLALLGKAGVGTSTGLKVVLIVAAAAIQMILPLFGHRAMLRVLRMMAPPFIVLFIILAILALPKAQLGAGHDGTWAEMFAALALVLSSGGYGWVMNANDFSRYLAPDTSARRIVWSVALGGFIPTTLLLMLGAAVATAVRDQLDRPLFLGADPPGDHPRDQALAVRAAGHRGGRRADRLHRVLGRVQHVHHRLHPVHDHLDRAVGGDLHHRLLPAARHL